MTKDDLLVTAAELSAPSAKARSEFSAKREQMAGLVNERQALRSDLAQLVGPDGQKMSEDNNRNFSMFMESLFTNFNSEVFVDTVLWVFRAYRAHGFQTIYWAANLSAWRETLQSELSQESFDAVSPFYAWLITNVPVFTLLTDGQDDEDLGHAQMEH